ncbi:CLUB [Artemisia annua]|uniref:CLUB n=1 Tax=Artemisia annua TaxID=35608 RepID=A0A2U1PRJ8_ARTAN|nr:CLUB [Artemisia annua]
MTTVLQHPSQVKRLSISAERSRNILKDMVSPSPRPRRLNSTLVRRNTGREIMAPRRRRASKEIKRVELGVFLSCNNRNNQDYTLNRVRFKHRGPKLLNHAKRFGYQNRIQSNKWKPITNMGEYTPSEIKDVSDLWPLVKKEFEERLPFKRVVLNNKTHNTVTVNNLPAEFILTTDSRIRSKFSPEQLVFWFQEPIATVVLVTCEDLDEFKTILKPRLKLVLQNEEEWFIVFVSKAKPDDDQANKMAKKVYARLEVDFNSRKRERVPIISRYLGLFSDSRLYWFTRCVKFDQFEPEATFWEDLELKLMDCLKNTFEKRIQFYEDELRKLSEQRLMPVWSFCNYFILKESLAFMFEMAHLYEDSLREYDELEIYYLQTVNYTAGIRKDFGGMDHGDDQSAMLKAGNKQLTQIVQDSSFREFEFRQYLFACQAKLLFSLQRPFEVASRGYSFIVSFSEALALHESILPFCTREVWVLTSCLSLVNATADHHKDGIVTPEIEKEYYRMRGELYSVCRVKFMRLAYLIGNGSNIERSPVNSASLSMVPWPKPATWPSVPSDASSEVVAQEKMILQDKPRMKHFGIHRKPLPLEPSFLPREANRRRPSSSVGNMFEVSGNSGSEAETFSSFTPPPSSVSRTTSIPVNFESTVDTMRLAEFFVAAKHALRKTISDPGLWKSLTLLGDFEKMYMELSKGASDNYHLSWWKRHGVVLEGEIANILFKHGNYDLAAKLYEKVCALYSGEGWQDLLADLLPNLAECQNILNDQPGYLSSCVRLLSLDKGLFLTNERQAFQSEVVRLAHGEMSDPVPLDVSSLITFFGNSGPPVELCDGDPGTLPVTLCSEFPDDITLESLSLTLNATNNADERVQAIRTCGVTILNPGRNTITLSLPPQKPGSYVLGVLTGQIGHLRFRSHGYSRGGPADIDDLMSYDKPTRLILKVSKPRPLVDVAAVVSSALLMNETQWVGISVAPLNYPLKDAILHIESGPGLKIEESRAIEMENYVDTACNADGLKDTNGDSNNAASVTKEFAKLTLRDGSIELPDWASSIVSVIWIPVFATSDTLAKGTSSGAISSQRTSVVNGLRTLNLKLEFGVSHNQIFKRTVPVHFTDPFHISTLVAEQGSDGALLLQVILNSQVKASLTIHDAWLDLQDGFSHTTKGDGRPTSNLLPLVVPATSRTGIFFGISMRTTTTEDEGKVVHPDTILNIKYSVSGDRNIGSHTPVSLETKDSKGDDKPLLLTFRRVLVIRRPVLEPFLVVGFVPLPSDGLRVGQIVTMKWRVERLKYADEELLYEVNANAKNWMIAGRKRGHATLSTKQGSRTEITILCVPLAAGYVRPPQLHLPNVNKANICCNPASPHLVCVLPPPLSSSFCIPA